MKQIVAGFLIFGALASLFVVCKPLYAEGDGAVEQKLDKIQASLDKIESELEVIKVRVTMNS